MRKPILDQKQFVVSRYRRQDDPGNGLDNVERVLMAILFSLVLFMAVAKIDENMQQCREGKTAAAAWTLHDTTNNPGRVKPIPNYNAVVND